MEFISKWISPVKKAPSYLWKEEEHPNNDNVNNQEKIEKELKNSNLSDTQKEAILRKSAPNLGLASAFEKQDDFSSLILKRSPSKNKAKAESLFPEDDIKEDVPSKRSMITSLPANVHLSSRSIVKKERGANPAALQNLNKAIVLVQSLMRMKIQRKKYLVLKKSIMLQAEMKEKKIKHRQNILNEIVISEKNYTEGLKICCELLIKPLLKSNLVSQDEAAQIFSNLDYKIVKIHLKLLNDLENRLDLWKNIKNPYEHLVGDIFLDLVDEFKSYRHYITNYNQSIQVLSDCTSKSPAFSAFFQEVKLNPATNLRAAYDFLIMPIQRLPRYELLFADLLRNTEEDHKDYKDIKECLEQIKIIVNFINELKRQADSDLRIEVVQKKVIGKEKPTSLYQEGRLLIREGKLNLVSSHAKETQLYVFLFSDIFLASKTTSIRKNLIDRTLRYEHEKTMSLAGFTVEDVTPGEHKGYINENCFKLVTKSGNIMFKAINQYQKNSWMTDISQAISKLPVNESNDPLTNSQTLMMSP